MRSEIQLVSNREVLDAEVLDAIALRLHEVLDVVVLRQGRRHVA
ncbi:MAG: hypothetical protein CNIPEHKO_00101 [Anaerolineales bacterium]|nr:hypothetical protein [Anaerolineales bacterium]